VITPFSQKFGIPRQGLNVSKAKGEIQFDEHIDVAQACEGIEQFSHLWVLFLFHENQEKGWTQRVRPPRMGGNQKIGVFATRSSFRPNAIGMSVVKLVEKRVSSLIIEGVDMLNNTPIIDIKPYVAYSDSVSQAHSGFASEPPQALLSIEYQPQAQDQLIMLTEQHKELPQLLENVLTYDPRPAYKTQKVDTKTYHIRLYDIEISFYVEDNTAVVCTLSKDKSE
jgi:tRNA-Thr(GGU) m(6)t(6)A37 methyltransferase TsaA